MLKNRTLFIIGAGASSEVGLPIGSKLAEQVKHLLTFQMNDMGHLVSGDGDFLQEAYQNTEPKYYKAYREAAARITRAIHSADSIDSCIDRFQDDPIIKDLGKAAIVKLITQAERASHLFVDTDAGKREIDTSTISHTWYAKFARILFQDLNRNTVRSVFNKLSIICFNYDRCIEHFLIYELMESFNLPRNDAVGLVNNLMIWHPYGSIGKLRFQDANGIGFGEDVKGRYFELSKTIKTFTEKIDDETELEPLKEAVLNAEAVVFLGYGFNPQNMKLFDPRSERNNINRIIFATALYEPSDGQNNIKQQIKRLYRRNSFAQLAVEDSKCCDLLHNYKRALTADR